MIGLIKIKTIANFHYCIQTNVPPVFADCRVSAKYKSVKIYFRNVFIQLDEKLLSDANNEHLSIFAKLQPFPPELRRLFSDPNHNARLKARDKNRKY